MGSLQVTTTPQAVILGSDGDSIVLKNDGPYTVYVDSNSSINSSSHAIPPTGTIAWDLNRELWIVADPIAGNNGYSSVSWIPNSQPAIFGNALDGILYTTSFTDPNAANPPQSTIYECTAYNSLVISINTPALFYAVGEAFSTFKVHSIKITWYDSTGTQLQVETMNVPAYYDGSPGLVLITVPIRGSYVAIVITPATALVFTTVRVLGTTRILDRGVQAGAQRTAVHYNPSLASGGATGMFPSADSVAVISTGTLATLNVLLPSPSGKLLVTWTTSTGGATAVGVIAFTSAITGMRLAGDIPIPIAGNNVATEVILPLYEPVIMIIQPVKISGAPIATSVHVTWEQE